MYAGRAICMMRKICDVMVDDVTGEAVGGELIGASKVLVEKLVVGLNSFHPSPPGRGPDSWESSPGGSHLRGQGGRIARWRDWPWFDMRPITRWTGTSVAWSHANTSIKGRGDRGPTVCAT